MHNPTIVDASAPISSNNNNNNNSSSKIAGKVPVVSVDHARRQDARPVSQTPHIHAASDDKSALTLKLSYGGSSVGSANSPSSEMLRGLLPAAERHTDVASVVKASRPPVACLLALLNGLLLFSSWLQLSAADASLDCLAPICTVQESCKGRLPSCAVLRPGIYQNRWVTLSKGKFSGTAYKPGRVNLTLSLTARSCPVIVTAVSNDSDSRDASGCNVELHRALHRLYYAAQRSRGEMQSDEPTDTTAADIRWPILYASSDWADVKDAVHRHRPNSSLPRWTAGPSYSAEQDDSMTRRPAASPPIGKDIAVLKLQLLDDTSSSEDRLRSDGDRDPDGSGGGGGVLLKKLAAKSRPTAPPTASTASDLGENDLSLRAEVADSSTTSTGAAAGADFPTTPNNESDSSDRPVVNTEPSPAPPSAPLYPLPPPPMMKTTKANEIRHNYNEAQSAAYGQILEWNVFAGEVFDFPSPMPAPYDISVKAVSPPAVWLFPTKNGTRLHGFTRFKASGVHAFSLISATNDRRIINGTLHVETRLADRNRLANHMFTTKVSSETPLQLTLAHILSLVAATERSFLIGGSSSSSDENNSNSNNNVTIIINNNNHSSSSSSNNNNSDNSNSGDTGSIEDNDDDSNNNNNSNNNNSDENQQHANDTLLIVDVYTKDGQNVVEWMRRSLLEQDICSEAFAWQIKQIEQAEVYAGAPHATTFTVKCSHWRKLYTKVAIIVLVSVMATLPLATCVWAKCRKPTSIMVSHSKHSHAAAAAVAAAASRTDGARRGSKADIGGAKGPANDAGGADEVAPPLPSSWP